MVRFNFPNEGLLKSKWISRGMLVTWPTSLHGLSMVFLLQNTSMQILHWDRCDSILWLYSFSYSVKKKSEIVSDVWGKFYYHGTTNGYFVLCYSWVTNTKVFRYQYMWQKLSFRHQSECPKAWIHVRSVCIHKKIF